MLMGFRTFLKRSSKASKWGLNVFKRLSAIQGCRFLFSFHYFSSFVPNVALRLQVNIHSGQRAMTVDVKPYCKMTQSSVQNMSNWEASVSTCSNLSTKLDKWHLSRRFSAAWMPPSTRTSTRTWKPCFKETLSPCYPKEDWTTLQRKSWDTLTAIL